MSALTALVRTEFTLTRRDLGAFFTIFAIPVGVLSVFSMMPGFQEPDPALGGLTPLDGFIAPIAVTLAVATAGLSMLPTTLATARELGVLRRLSTTPVRPTLLLAAQLLVSALMSTAAVVTAIAVGMGLGLQLPGHVSAFVLALVLGTVALFAVGLLIGAIAPSSGAATGIGMSLLLPLMAISGVWVPVEHLPEAVQVIGRGNPLGATLEAVRQAWGGALPEGWLLATLAAWAVVAGTVAAWRFRWQ